MRHDGLVRTRGDVRVFVADDLGAWLVGALADASRRRLITLVLGSDQDRALGQAATAAVQLTARELCPQSSEQADELAVAVSQVFSDPMPELRASAQTTLLETLQAGIARQLAVLDDAGLTGTGESAAQVLGISVPVLAEKLAGYLVQEIRFRGASGGPLAMLAAQLNHDVTHLQGQRLEGMVGKLTDALRNVLTRPDRTRAMPANLPALQALGTADPVGIGPYRLLGLLGSSGMGRVYLGRSPGGRLVAVKVIHDDVVRADPGFRELLDREIGATLRVSGIFTAPLVNCDLDASPMWVATGYVAGPSLDRAVTDYGPLPVSSVLALAAGLAEGLDAVHRASCVHRDLKPSTVLLASDGPRIIGVGINPGRMPSAALKGLCTPMFMSPEQCEGSKEIHGSSDIFSLGSVLVYAATGRTPFRDGRTSEIIGQIICGKPDLSGVPEQVRSIIERCLDRNPPMRPSIQEILAELGHQRFEAGWLPPFFAEVLPRYDFAPAVGGDNGPSGGCPSLKMAAQPGNTLGSGHLKRQLASAIE
jgi:hypothetical protein